MVTDRRSHASNAQIQYLTSKAQLLGFDSPWLFMEKHLPAPGSKSGYLTAFYWERLANYGDLTDAIKKAQEMVKIQEAQRIPASSVATAKRIEAITQVLPKSPYTIPQDMLHNHSAEIVMLRIAEYLEMLKIQLDGWERDVQKLIQANDGLTAKNRGLAAIIDEVSVLMKKVETP